jgi:hypothetical protein
MWAQIIKMRLKPGLEGELPGLVEQLRMAEQPDSGLLQTITMQDQDDPCQVYTLVVFESEEKARVREQDPRRAEMLTSMRAKMAELVDGPPEFVNLTVLNNR